MKLFTFLCFLCIAGAKPEMVTLSLISACFVCLGPVPDSNVSVPEVKNLLVVLALILCSRNGSKGTTDLM